MRGWVGALAVAATLVAPGALADEGHWSLDASVGVPRLTRDGFRIIGGGSAAWATSGDGRALVFAGRGDAAAWDFSSARAVQQGERALGELAFGGRLGSGTRALSFAAEVGAASYDAVTISQETPLRDEGSTLLRGGARIGAWIGGARGFVDASAAVAAQHESYGRTVVATAGQSVAVDDDTRLTVRFAGRLAAAIQLVPGVVSLRGSAELGAFKLRRDTTSLRLAAGSPPSATAGTELTRQLEARGRLFADLEVFSFIGLTPAVYVGADLVRVDGGGDVVTAVVPSAGVGLFRR